MAADLSLRMTVVLQVSLRRSRAMTCDSPSHRPQGHQRSSCPPAYCASCSWWWGQWEEWFVTLCISGTQLIY
jgi:hypothetical protein